MSSESKKDKNFIRIDLTEAQQQQVFEQVGQKADAIELSTSELEERIAPRARGAVA